MTDRPTEFQETLARALRRMLPPPDYNGIDFRCAAPERWREYVRKLWAEYDAKELA